MALVGGGGAPGSVGGGGASSTGTSLNYVGSHVYAYSGAFAANTNTAIIGPVLNFTTGSEYIVGKMTLNPCCEISSVDVAGTYMRIKLNDEQVAMAFTSSAAVDAPSVATIDLVLPPFTKVLVEVWADSTDADDLGNVQFIGRIY
jgi:hypothetical protein